MPILGVPFLDDDDSGGEGEEIKLMPIELRGRHAKEAPIAPMLWKCPACNAENSGRLELGCVVCGSGKPGEHVGIQPPVVSAPPPKQAEGGDLSGLDQAFLEWIRPFRGKYDSATETLLYEAFKAGAIYAAMQTPQAGPPLTGTAESRTIVAALRLFVENILPNAKEEIASGEYLSIAETEALISKLERTL